MHRFAAMLVIAILYGCAPSMVASKKISSYSGTISQLAIAVAEPSQAKVRASGTYAGSAQSKTSAAVASLNRALQNSLPNYFSAKGLSSKLVTEAERTSAEYSHNLVITPVSASASCYYASCQAMVRIATVMQDSRTKQIVWVGTFDIPEASAFHAIDHETAHKVGSLIWEAFRAENLVVDTK